MRVQRRDRAAHQNGLKGLLTVTDVTPAGLDPDALLTGVLDRVRHGLNADTAAVLLLDEGAEYLRAYAARGLEEEVRQGVRIPVGVGFAGAIALRQRPLGIDRVGPDTVVNPILWDRGVHAMLGAPMVHQGQVIGVMHVGRFDGRPFTARDSDLLMVAAEGVAGIVAAWQFASEQAAAEVLERSLLPRRFPRVAGMQFAGRYAPAAGRPIGGDWYDTFTLPDGTLWLVVGDVAGHGMRSAVVMGRIRSTLRAYTLLGEAPARVLELTDRKVHHFEMGAMTTILCAVSRPPFETFEITCAGHPAPVLAPPGGDAVLVDVDTNLPLGSIPGQHRTSVRVDVPLGAMVMLYTDGLVETRGTPITEGMERLRQVVTADHPEIACSTAMLRMVGNRAPDDDIALLAARRIGQ